MQVTFGGDVSKMTTTDANGNYKFEHLPNGNYTITPAKAGYRFEPGCNDVTMNNLDVAGVDFTATVAAIITGDIDGSGTVDLKDAIIAFKALCGMYPKDIHSGADVNGDGRIGLEEAIHILQVVSRLKTQ